MIIKIKGRRRRNRKKTGRTISGSRLVYARPSFLEGVARIFDFGGTLNTYYLVSSDEDPREVDARAIASDWEAVGKDFPIVANWHIRYAKPDNSPKSDA